MPVNRPHGSVVKLAVLRGFDALRGHEPSHQADARAVHSVHWVNPSAAD